MSNISNRAIEYAGQVVIESVEYMKYGADSIVITNQVDSISVYEDMFSPFITGEIRIKDTLSLPTMFGRSGKDMVYISVANPSIKKKLSGMFWVYKMADRESLKDRLISYTLYFASAEMMFDTTHPISRKFSGDCDVIAEKLVKESFRSKKTLVSDKSENSVSFVSNFWTASKSLKYLTDRSISKKTKMPGYMFYENRDGFNFRDIATIFKEDPIIKLDYSDYLSDVLGGRVIRDPEKEFRTPTGLRVDVTYDFLKEYMDGAVKSKLYTFDIVTKKVTSNVFDIGRSKLDSPNQNRLWTGAVVDSVEPVIRYMSRGYGTFGLFDNSNHLSIQQRTALLSTLVSNRIEVDLHGRTDLTCGRMVSVEIEQLRSIGKTESRSDYIDRLYSGKYIITAIAHHISREKHTCTAELCKESTQLP